MERSPEEHRMGVLHPKDRIENGIWWQGRKLPKEFLTSGFYLSGKKQGNNQMRRWTLVDTSLRRTEKLWRRKEGVVVGLGESHTEGQAEAGLKKLSGGWGSWDRGKTMSKSPGPQRMQRIIRRTQQ